MSTKETLEKVLAALPEPQLSKVLDFAQYLRWSDKLEQEERQAWLNFGPEPPGIYAANEPEYLESLFLEERTCGANSEGMLDMESHGIHAWRSLPIAGRRC